MVMNRLYARLLLQNYAICSFYLFKIYLIFLSHCYIFLFRLSISLFYLSYFLSFYLSLFPNSFYQTHCSSFVSFFLSNYLYHCSFQLSYFFLSFFFSFSLFLLPDYFLFVFASQDEILCCEEKIVLKDAENGPNYRGEIYKADRLRQSIRVIYHNSGHIFVQQNVP